MRRFIGFLTCLLVLSGSVVSATSQAQQVERIVGDYRGVTPGTSHNPGHLVGQAGSNPVIVTWPGFQITPAGSRVFVQLTSGVTFEPVREANRWVIMLRGAQVPERQSLRPLDTRFFNTPLTRAFLERRGADTALVLELRADVVPNVTSAAGPDGYSYLYVDFGNGNYVEGGNPVRPGSRPAATNANNNSNRNEPGRNERPVSRDEMNAIENERPPGQ